MAREHEAGRLYDEFGASLFRYALMILADREAAQDAIHHVFTALVVKGAGKLDQPEHYLRRAVRNACYSALRERSAALRRTGPGPEALLETTAATAGISEEIRLTMEAAIRELPPEQREVLHLHAFEGRTFREVAEMTSAPLNTVASRYRYAIDRLRLLLTDRQP
jgi:RNA polymerase sigma-70 factor (ECF subfamily)